MISKLQGENLLKVAALLETLPRNRFNYSVWVGKDWKGATDLSCGTKACALGWATTIPEFHAQGLRLGTFDPEAGDSNHGLSQNTERACKVLFGVGAWDDEGPFQPQQGLDEENQAEYGDDASPKQVAQRIREFVEANVEK